MTRYCEQFSRQQNNCNSHQQYRRMKCYRNNLIDPRQNPFIKGRHIGDNIRLLFDVIDLTSTSKIPGSVFTADIIKVFDSLN